MIKLKDMNFTANTRPPAPKRERGGNLSWIFFLLILARPLWGIVRSLVGPQISNQQIWLMIGGVLVVSAVVALIARNAGGRAEQSRLPTPSATGGSSLPFPPATNRPAMPGEWRPGSSSGYPSRPPQFEPMLTGKVLLAGLVLALLIGGALALVILG